MMMFHSRAFLGSVLAGICLLSGSAFAQGMKVECFSKPKNGEPASPSDAVVLQMTLRDKLFVRYWQGGVEIPVQKSGVWMDPASGFPVFRFTINHKAWLDKPDHLLNPGAYNFTSLSGALLLNEVDPTRSTYSFNRIDTFCADEAIHVSCDYKSVDRSSAENQLMTCTTTLL